MYKDIKAASQMGTRRRIIIDEVNLAQNFVSGKDRYGLTFRITFNLHEPGIITIPQQGELWVVEQYKQEWRLKYKLQDLSTYTELNPGDKLLVANTLWVVGDLNFSQTNPYTPVHSVAGYTAGVGSNVTVDGYFTGGIGTTAYTIDDIVAALKTLGVFPH